MKCRICEEKLSEPFLSLGNQPLSNSYLTEQETHAEERTFPLELHFCPKCRLVQLAEYENPKNIFSSYSYFSSNSLSWVKHAENYAEMIAKKLKLDKDSFVLECASNDGYLLQWFIQKNIPCLGVEPAENIAKFAVERGIPTDNCFFNSDYGLKLKSENRQADLIVCNNVLAHVPALNDFVEGLKLALKPKGVITIEVPHLLNLIKENQFDTAYHEHFSYFSLFALDCLFSKHDLVLFNVEEIPTHGGSLRVYVKHKENLTYKYKPNVLRVLNKESEAGLLDENTYLSFANQVEHIKRKCSMILYNLKESGNSIVAYGAAAKGNTFLNYCGFRTDVFDYVVDNTLDKQGKFLPGSKIPIYPESRINVTKPDYIVILPWNWKDEIVAKNQQVKEWDGKFMVMLPEVKIISGKEKE